MGERYYSPKGAELSGNCLDMKFCLVLRLACFSVLFCCMIDKPPSWDRLVLHMWLMEMLAVGGNWFRRLRLVQVG